MELKKIAETVAGRLANHLAADRSRVGWGEEREFLEAVLHHLDTVEPGEPVVAHSLYMQVERERDNYRMRFEKEQDEHADSRRTINKCVEAIALLSAALEARGPS